MPKLDFKADTGMCYEIKNLVRRFGRATKVPGTERVNATPVGNKFLWATRYYGRKSDNTYVKKTFAYAANGSIYMFDETDGTTREVVQAMTSNCIPESVTVQVAGNSRMYITNGYDPMKYYEGDDAGTFNDSAITYKFAQCIIKDDRLWGFEKNSSLLYASRTLDPEDFSANYVVAITVGNDKESYIRRIELLGNDLYVFKNDSIWILRGTTKSTYTVDMLIPNMGLLAQRAICQLSSALVFVCQQDKEIYEFTGSVSPRKISSNIKKKLGGDNGTFSEMINPYRTDEMVCIHDTVNRLFRLSYKNIEYQEEWLNSELIFPTDDFEQGNMPKWSETYGAAVGCYMLATRQGDNYLVTGRSDIGCLMWHNRHRNWDNTPMEVVIRFDDIVPNIGKNNDFEWVFVHGRPSSGTITMRTYLNQRQDTYSSQSLSDVGEKYTLGSITIENQYMFNSTIPLLIGYNHGESLSIELLDSSLDKDIEIEDISVNVIPRERIIGTTVGLVG